MEHRKIFTRRRSDKGKVAMVVLLLAIGLLEHFVPFLTRVERIISMLHFPSLPL
jgi:hypothetical protein